MILPSPIRASTQGVPSQSSNGTSAANFICAEANRGATPAIAQAIAARAKVLKASQEKGMSVLRLIRYSSTRLDQAQTSVSVLPKPLQLIDEVCVRMLAL